MRSISQLPVATALAAFLALTGSAHAVTLDFGDSTINALGGPVDPTAYLASFGITVTNVTAGAAMQIRDDREVYGGGVIFSTSLHNVMEQGGGHPVSYELDFSTPVTSLSFWRVGVNGSTTTPTWNATFYNGATSLSSVGEGFNGATGQPAHQYFLPGTGNRLVVNGDHGGFAAFQTVVIDDLSFTPVPEPASLLVTACGAIALLMRRRRA